MSQTQPEPSDVAEPPRPSLLQAALLIDQAASNISYDRANSLAIQAMAHAAVCQTVVAEQQAKILAGIRDRLDALIAQNVRNNPRLAPPRPPSTPPVPPTFSQR